MESLRCTIMRGGTSKAVFLREEDLPPPGPERDALVLRVFGSPDRRQIDGLGGADPLTSKMAIIGPPRDYLYALKFPSWMVFAPGPWPVLGDAVAYVGMIAIGHAAMWLVAGGAHDDALARQ